MEALSWKRRTRDAFALALAIVAIQIGHACRADDDAAAKRLAAQRKVKIVELMSMVGDPMLVKMDRPKVVQAILALGELKAVEAVPLLAEKLGFHRSATGRYKHFISVEHMLPAVKALRLIGKPALTPIMDAVSSRDRPWMFRSGARSAILRITGGSKQADAAVAEYRKKYLKLAREYTRRAGRLEKVSDKKIK